MIDVEFLDREGNVAVLRLPDRKFPGILVQGDTMATFRDLLANAVSAGDASDEIQEAHVRVAEWMQYYESVLKSNGIRRPY
jgi:hypothetical protein